MKKKIIYITSSRADFGIVSSLLLKLEKSSKIDFYLIVTGTHFLKKFGYSFQEIEDLKISNVIKIKFSQKKIDNLNHYIGELSKKYSDIVDLINPDSVILLGDRYEIAQIALLTHIKNIPIIHLHGGEKTIGSKDDNYRHSISKLAQYHFVSHENFKKRLIQLGEVKSKIFNIGSISLENIKTSNIISITKKDQMNFLKSKNKFFIVTLHPSATLKSTKKVIQELKKAILNFNNINFIFTSPNIDLGYKIIMDEINRLVLKHKNIYFYKNLGIKNYFSLLKLSSGIIGNSSSGIIEAPFFKKPSINIGNRQTGRLFSSTIYNSEPSHINIQKLIKKICSSKFKINTSQIYIKKNPEASNKVLSFIINCNFKDVSLNKNFRDII
jgi:UDP-hydrolysing UDP-N-acetyl-D-glucosamine 2-epimerase